tara:strand:- start:380 stop:853 length:474 start_codon:yes stop_codon:yes gene_type:complete
MYGKKDGAAFGSLTATIAAGTLNKITFSATIASYGVQPGDTIIFDTAAGSGGADAQHLKVKYVESTTVLVMTKNGTAAADKDCELQQAPRFLTTAEVAGKTVLGASTTETSASSPGTITHAGWVKKHSKTRGGVTKYWYETLVASSSITDDVVATDF